MNTKEKATQGISDFLRSDSKVLLLTGTHQNEKHSLALSLILSEYPSPASILFRVNHSMHIRSFLLPVIVLVQRELDKSTLLF